MAGEIGVSIDRDFARFGSKAYAINKINTVDIATRIPVRRHSVGGCRRLSACWYLAAARATRMRAVSDSSH
jgi:hypothetical protein